MHEAVGRADLGLSGHAAFETYSVLTRLPGSQRRPPAVVAELLHVNFPETVFLSVEGSRAVHLELASLGIAGGLVYDALVAAAAVEAQLPLMTRDQRALDVYRGLGVEVLVVD